MSAAALAGATTVRWTLHVPGMFPAAALAPVTSHWLPEGSLADAAPPAGAAVATAARAGGRTRTLALLVHIAAVADVARALRLAITLDAAATAAARAGAGAVSTAASPSRAAAPRSPEPLEPRVVLRVPRVDRPTTRVASLELCGPGAARAVLLALGGAARGAAAAALAGATGAALPIPPVEGAAAETETPRIV
jgi:hypothetical protein